MAGEVQIKTYLSETQPIQCTSSTIEGKTLAGAGNPLGFSISHWSLANCAIRLSNINFPCTVTETKGPWSASLNYSAFSVGGGGKELLWQLQCPWQGIECTMGIASDLLLTSGTSPLLSASNETMTTAGGSACPEPKTFSFSATYIVTSPKPAYPRYAGPQPPSSAACKVTAEYCESSKTFPSGTEIKTQPAKLKLDMSLGELTCSETTLSPITTTATYGEPSLPVKGGEFQFSGCKVVGASCSIVETGAGASSITQSSGAGVWRPGNRLWHVSCPGIGLECAIPTEEAALTVSAGAWEVKASSLPLKKSGSCGEQPKLTVTFLKTESTPWIYFTHALL